MEEIFASNEMNLDILYEQMDLSGMEEKFNALFPAWEISVQDLLMEIMGGNGAEALMEQAKNMVHLLFAEVDAIKYVCATLLLIGMISTVFMNFNNIFPGQQIGDFAFQFTYLILIIFLLKVNAEIFAVAKEGLENIVMFLQVFLPVYFIVVGSTGGSATAMGFYQVFMIGIYFVEQILITFILPAISCYMLLCIMNGVWEEERLTLFIGLVKKSIQTILKVLLTFAVGSGIFQSMITPVIDAAKFHTIKKTVEIIPGVGELAEGSVQIVLGMSVFLKNSMGILFMVLLLLLCAIPILKVFLFMFVVKGSAGLMGISADKRIIACTNLFGDGILLLLQTMITSVMFFLILVLMVSSVANRGYL